MVGLQLTAARALPAVVALLLIAAQGGGAMPGGAAWRAALLYIGHSPVAPCYQDLAFAPALILSGFCRRAGVPCPALEPPRVPAQGTLGCEETGMYGLNVPDLRERYSRMTANLGRLSAQRAASCPPSSSSAPHPSSAAQVAGAAGRWLPAALGPEFCRAVAAALAESLGFLHELHARLATTHALRAVTDPRSGELSRPGLADGTCFKVNLHAAAMAGPAEKGALLEAIAMLKNLAALVTSCRAWALPVLQRNLVVDLQYFFRGIAGEAQLRGHDVLQAQLYAFRALAVDFSSQMPAELSGNLGVPSALHLFLLQELGSALLETEGSSRKLGGVFGAGGVLDAEATGELRRLLHRSAAYEPLANLDAYLRRHVSLAFLWHRELHVEQGTAGVPIELSLPWGLVQHALAHLKHFRPEQIMIPFEIFSDAADSILGEGRKQHTFRELQAEVNLVFDQLVFHLADDVFASLKAVATLQTMDKALQAKLADGLELAGQRLARHVAAHGQVDILGKKIDMKHLLTKRLNRLLRENLDYLFERFEAQDARSGLMELDSLVAALRGTHGLLARLFSVDPWARLHREMNEATSLRSFSSRASATVLEEIADEVLPNSLFNCFTRRFVAPIAPGEPFHESQFARSAWPVLPNPGYLYGHKSVNDALREWAKKHSGFLGWNHIMAALRVLDSGEIVALAHHLQKRLISVVGFSLPDTLEPLILELKSLLQGLETTIPHEVFSALEEDLGAFREDPAVREIMHGFREVGNVLAFLLLLDDCAAMEGVLARGAGAEAEVAPGAASGAASGAGARPSDGPQFLAEALLQIDETIPDEWREAPDDFALAWSALMFVYCLGGGKEPGPALFGDGFLFGGCAMLFLLGCHKDFQSNDPTYLIFAGRHSLAPELLQGAGLRAAWLDNAAGALAAYDQALCSFAAHYRPTASGGPGSPGGSSAASDSRSP